MPLQDGFRAQSETGLLVPESVAEPRKRVTFTRSEWKGIERSVKLMKSRGVSTFYKCDNPNCDGKPLALHRDPISGKKSLRCACTDRIMQDAF